MKQKTSLNIKKRVFAGIAVSALALATVAGAVNFGTIADAARGILDNAAEYGEQLKDHAPGDLNLSELQDSSDTWYWVDNSDTYFGKPGNQKFVVANADLNNGGTPTAYKEVTVPVQKRSVAPVVKQGTISGTAANYTTTAKASIDRYKRTITVTAGEGGTVSGSGTYVIGESVTLTATPAKGYKFTGWSDEDNSNPRTITVNDNTAYTATFEAINTIPVTSVIPTKSGDVSIMTLDDLFIALGGSASTYNLIFDYSKGYSSSTYYVYGIVGNKGNNSTPDNLQTVGLDWYKQLNKPTTNNQTFSSNGQTLFGGPLDYIYHYGSLKYDLAWYYQESEDNIYSQSRDRIYWNDDVIGSVYVAVVCTTDTAITSSLPSNSGDVSIMTLNHLFVALGGLTSTDGLIRDPSAGYNSSTYYVYGIVDPHGNASTSANLQAVGDNWYKELNKPTTYDNRWENAGKGSYSVFGGPLHYIYYRSRNYGQYYFLWYYSENDICNSCDGNVYWWGDVSGSVCVAVVHS